MPDIVGVRFKKAGKVYYFGPAGFDLKVNDNVVVQTARGVEIGQVVIAPKQGPGTKIKNVFSKIKEKLKRRKKPQKEVTQYFVNSSNNIINYS